MYEEKVGNVPSFAGNEATRRGSRLEPVILAEYQELTGQSLKVELPFYTHPAHPFLGCTPDAERVSDLRLVEAKALNAKRARELGEPGSDWIPDDWLFQVQTQMAVMGVQECDVAAFIDVADLRVFHVEANPDVQACIIEAAENMARRIEQRVPPDWDWRHPATRDLVKTIYREVDDGQIIDLDQEVHVLWLRHLELNERISSLQYQNDEIKARVMAAMGNAKIGKLPGADFELVRNMIPEAPVSYVRKAYVRLQQRKVRHAR